LTFQSCDQTNWSDQSRLVRMSGFLLGIDRMYGYAIIVRLCNGFVARIDLSTSVDVYYILVEGLQSKYVLDMQIIL
jgi:hypothetical protein